MTVRPVWIFFLKKPQDSVGVFFKEAELFLWNWNVSQVIKIAPYVIPNFIKVCGSPEIPESIRKTSWWWPYVHKWSWSFSALTVPLWPPLPQTCDWQGRRGRVAFRSRCRKCLEGLWCLTLNVYLVPFKTLLSRKGSQDPLLDAVQTTNPASPSSLLSNYSLNT